MRSFNSKSELYRGGSYLSIMADRACEILEPDIYSDVSLDTSSHDDTWYARQGNQINYSRSDINNMKGSNYKYHGSTDMGDERLGKFHELYNSWYSDDEMSELLPLDESIYLQGKMLEEQEELRYLTELVYQDIAASKLYEECHSDVPWDNHVTADLFHSRTSMWEDTFDEDDLLRIEQPMYQDDMSKWNLSQSPIISEANVTRNETFCSDNSSVKDMGKQTQRLKQHQESILNETEKQENVLKVSFESRLPENLASTGNQGSDSNAEQKIFLGGLPLGMTERGLRQELAAQGYKVLKRPKIIRGFAPQVLMRSVDEAKALVEKGVITINGSEVQVRPFNSLMKQSKSKKIPNVERRSIFLGGLPSGTTSRDIKEVLMRMDIKVVNYPVVKFGYSRQVILETFSQAKTLINMGKVLINGTFVDVRPFMNQ